MICLLNALIRNTVGNWTATEIGHDFWKFVRRNQK